MSKTKIIRNVIRCNHCGAVIESKSVHDYAECLCGRVYVDGGHDYLWRGYLEPGDYTDMSIIEVEEDEGNDSEAEHVS